MKGLDEIIKERRSIRSYLDKPVEKEKIEKILDSARLAPSACNAQPWRFVVVQDLNIREKIINKGLGGLVVPNSWAKSAPVLIIVCSETDLFTHKIGERIQGVQYHLIDIGISMEHLVLKATELGLGSCYIGWFKGNVIKKILKFPLSWKVECLITLGYPKEIPKELPRRELSDIVRYF